MAFTIVLVIAAVLFGSVIGILAILVAGIHSDDRARNLTSTPRTGTEAVTRRLLGIGIRTARADTAKTTRSDEPMPPDRPDSCPEGDLT